MIPKNPLSPLHDLRFTEQEKRLIRQRVVDHQQRGFRLHNIFFVSRIAGYVAVSCVGLFVLISSFVPQPHVSPELHQALFTLVSDNQSVQASTLGRLLEIQGVVHVINNGTILPKTDIAAGEIVVLQPGAELVVQIRSHVFATITGPAKFVLEYIPETNQTIVNLLEGKLIEVATQKVTPVTTNHDTTAPTNGSNTPQASIVIKTKLVEVSPPSDQETTFIIEQEDTSAEVITTSGNVVVKHLITADGNQLTVDAGQVAQINQHSMEINIPENDEAATKLARSSKDLHIRYMIETQSSENTTPESASFTGSDDDTSRDTLSPLEQIVQKSDTQTKKRVLEIELMRSLEQALHPTITQQNLEQMRQWKENNTDAYIIAYRNLLDQLHRAYTLLDIPQPTTQTDSVSAGIHVANNLITHLETTSTLPPSLRASLQLIVNGLRELQTYVPQDSQDTENTHNSPPVLHESDASPAPDAPTPDVIDPDDSSEPTQQTGADSITFFVETLATLEKTTTVGS